MKYHLIGDRGISMSAIADILRFLGNEVSGSDLKSGGHNAKNITQDINVVIRSSAINPGSEGWVEVEAAQKLGIKVIKRSEILKEITSSHKLIAISGMHGKTTTTSMCGLIMLEAGLDPTVLIGEKIREFGDKAYHYGKSKYFVLEACEYDRSFLDLFPQILILTNIDLEHTDTYPGGLDEITKTFSEYLKNVKPNGTIIANSEDENIIKILAKYTGGAKTIWYGRGSDKYTDLPYELALSGYHNRLNALAALALCDELNLPRDAAKKVFENFCGAKRRLEYWGELNNSLLFDDYGHHPTEIKATIQALREKYPHDKIVIIFWPHQFRRVKDLLEQFSEALSGADEVYVKDIYFVPGRDEVLDVSSQQIVDKINQVPNKAIKFEKDSEIIDEIIDKSKQRKIFITMGIPPIYKIWEEINGDIYGNNPR